MNLHTYIQDVDCVSLIHYSIHWSTIGSPSCITLSIIGGSTVYATSARLSNSTTSTSVGSVLAILEVMTHRPDKYGSLGPINLLGQARISVCEGRWVDILLRAILRFETETEDFLRWPSIPPNKVVSVHGGNSAVGVRLAGRSPLDRFVR